MSINKIRFTDITPAVRDDSHLNRPEIFYQDTILLDLTEKITK
jgi:hypothetical protein